MSKVSEISRQYHDALVHSRTQYEQMAQVPADVSTGARSDDRHPHRLLLRDASAQTQDAAKTGGNPAQNLTKSY